MIHNAIQFWNVFHAFNTVKLTKDETSDTRNFSIEAKKEGSDDYSIYHFGDNSRSSYLTVTVDWTQSGM